MCNKYKYWFRISRLAKEATNYFADFHIFLMFLKHVKSGTEGFSIMNKIKSTDNIVDLDDNTVDTILDQLRPVVYEDVNPQFGFEGDTYIGLIAEDVHAIDPRLTVNDYKYEFTNYGTQRLVDGKGPRTVRYDRLVLPLILSNRKQRIRIAALEAELRDIKNHLGIV